MVAPGVSPDPHSGRVAVLLPGKGVHEALLPRWCEKLVLETDTNCWEGEPGGLVMVAQSPIPAERQSDPVAEPWVW